MNRKQSGQGNSKSTEQSKKAEKKNMRLDTSLAYSADLPSIRQSLNGSNISEKLPKLIKSNSLTIAERYRKLLNYSGSNRKLYKNLPTPNNIKLDPNAAIYMQKL